MTIEFAVMGGSGLYEMAGLTEVQEYWVETPLGQPSDAIFSACHFDL
ncbi:MAG: hypothetical protein FD135_1987 [Comamonadaceae bacterium]|nr:MAG: hypothetical protein FD135_1987 [Comamonadaceae bacterium]